MSETKEITSDKELKNKTEAISVDKIEVIAPQQSNYAVQEM